MIERFVDTSGWAEWADQSLAFHSQAVGLFNEVWGRGGRLVTTDFVLAELTALLNSPIRMPKPKQIELLDAIQADTSVEILSLDALQRRAAWDLWKARADKTWSFVDCSSFVVMQQRRLSEALTTDHHFEQAGFVRLLK
jgi:predicted nucleic acid-binding protein